MPKSENKKKIEYFNCSIYFKEIKFIVNKLSYKKTQKTLPTDGYMLVNSVKYIRNSANPTQILPENRGEMVLFQLILWS